ncbi:MAG: hypothetical protein SGARI_005435 [Bacillariaceae sp.]
MWVPSPLPPVTLWTLVKAGFWQLPIKFGWNTTKRLFEVLGVVDKDHETQQEETATALNDDGNDDDETNPFISLERMVVLPEYQGNGYGSKALRQLLDEVDADNSTMRRHVRLSTQEERNVRFYKRLGFEVIDERQFAPDPDSKYGFTNWTMVRK